MKTKPDGIWEKQIQENPQLVIENLVKQTTRQAKAIHLLNLEVEKLKKLLAEKSKTTEKESITIE